MKVLNATCEAGVVKVANTPVPDAEILSEGVGASEGVLVLDEDRVKYLAKISPDLKSALDRVSEALEGTIAALQAIDSAGYIISVSGGSGAPAVGVPSTPVAASDISTIESAKGALDELKEALR